MTKEQLHKLPLWQYIGEQLLEFLNSRTEKPNLYNENDKLREEEWVYRYFRTSFQDDDGQKYLTNTERRYLARAGPHKRPYPLA